MIMLICIKQHLSNIWSSIPEKVNSSAWFLPAFFTAIAHRNNFFYLLQQNKSSVFKVKFRQAKNPCRRVLEATNLVQANKAKKCSTTQRFVSQDFWWIANSFLNKVSRLSLLYLMVLQYFLLYVIRQSCLLKYFLINLYLKNHVSLYLLSLQKIIWN